MKHPYETIIVPASVIIPIGAGIVKKCFQSTALKIVFTYLIFAGGVSAISIAIGKYHINNLPLFNLYAIGEFLFIVWYFQKIFSDKNIDRIITIINILFSVLSVLNFVYFESVYSYNSYTKPIGAIIIILLCLYHIFRQSETDIKKKWSQLSENWIIIGLLIYFCSSFFYFTFFNLINETTSDAMFFVLGKVHATLVLIMYLLFARGFWIYKHE